MAKIREIEGIGPAYAEKLEAQGINTVEKLLERCASKKAAMKWRKLQELITPES
jgi:predicted flap endonuclease-1-like 5' DNA nuclease